MNYRINFLIILLLIYFLYNFYSQSNFLSKEAQYDLYGNTQNTAVNIKKPTLTLYYDRYNKYSSAFYDDTITMELYNLLNEEKDIKNIIKKKGFGVWNQIKLLYKQGNFPFLNSKMITLEEVYCKDGEMPKCVEKNMITFKEEIAVLSPSSSETETYLDIDFSKTKQYPRNENLVDKLPKVIFTYQKYEDDGIIKGVDTKIVEYEGIYNINNEFEPMGRNNLLQFLEFIMRDRLEFKIGKDENEKNKFHNIKINNINNNLSEHKFNIPIVWNKDNLPNNIKSSPHFNLDFKEIKKCNQSSEFIII